MRHGLGDVQAPTNQADGLADTSTARTSSSLFEDDEDLFRPELAAPPDGPINGGQPQPQPAANEENNDNTSQQQPEQMIEFSDNGDLGARPAANDERDAYLGWILQREAALNADRFMGAEMAPARESPARPMDARDNDDGAQSELTNTNDRAATQRPALAAAATTTTSTPTRHNQVSSFLAAAPRPQDLGASGDSAKSRLVKLVHRLAPELSCYTGLGEHYHGHIATASDQRPCLNWLHVRLALAKWPPAGPNRSAAHLESSAYASRLDNHNACRNPNSDERGPWCFVAHSELLDGRLARGRGPADATQRLKTNKQRAVWLGAGEQLFVARPCAIGSCSEYLWLYVVAPPLGLLVLLTCLISVIIRTIRKSHYNAIFSAAYQRHNNAHNSSSRPGHSPSVIARGLGKMFRSRAKRRSKAAASKKSPANYLDEDIFEIVDDIDWSEGPSSSSHANSMSSPKSSESFKLNAAAFSAGRSTLTHSKSINPMLADRTTESGADKPPQPPPRMASNMSKSKSQAGPMFATLRCHVRNTQKQRLADSTHNRCPQQPKSSIIDNADLPTNSEWLDASITSNLSSLQADNSSPSAARTGHLISCSSSSSSSTCGNNAPPGHNGNAAESSGEKFILARDLPMIDSASVTISHETQPIYEGKFSQAQWAYLKQRHTDATQATGRIGAQVAVCGLKPQATLDERVFAADNLKLRNLNHLNVLKLIGYVQYDKADDNQRPFHQEATCALVYDMAHLMDLSDWLKEQSKEAVVARCDDSNGDLSLRQNLTCLAKQIALAVDYLHDKQIVYKDLACRNCFLDVTRMLVKLATFNSEPEFDQPQSEYDVPQVGEQLAAATTAQGKMAHAVSAPSDPTPQTNDDLNKRLNLKSMVRPKYLLDYYVIDSRPSECQLLPLSWIPLESILFNKFNRQTDIWSFGCLLYELFSLGEVAYFGYSSKQVIDSVRSNLMPPQPMLCPNGIYKLMCKCLSDIPTLRPNIKHVYEQLNLYSGQCSSFLNHHLCII